MSIQAQELFNEELIGTMWDMVYELEGQQHTALYDLLVWSEPDAGFRVSPITYTEGEVLDMLDTIEGISADVDRFVEFCMVVASMRF